MKTALTRINSYCVRKLCPRSFQIMDAIKEISTDVESKSIKEGKAEILLQSERVFYNPVQEFNRDLSIAVLSVFGEEYLSDESLRKRKKIHHGIKSVDCQHEAKSTSELGGISILEALSATGLRSIRYAKEIQQVTKIVANDISHQAVETIKANISHNGVENIVVTSHNDACMVMYQHKAPADRFTAIDLDPYGCPAQFLDGAVQSVAEGGLLLVTATDMAILCGNSPETCYVKYGAVSLKVKCCHEMALRIVLQCVESHANRYGRYIVPLLSVSADFYVRVFVRVHSGAVHCKRTTSKLSMVYACVGCDTLTLQPLGGFRPNPTDKNPKQEKGYLPPVPPVGERCEHCNQRHHLGGPVWSAPIHDEAFVCKVLAHVQRDPGALRTSRRIEGVLSVVREELTDVPLYYLHDKLFGRAHLEVMPLMTMRSAILNAGYKVSYSHAARNSLKTNAPARLVWDAVRAWARTHPASTKHMESDPVAAYLLSQEPRAEINFNLRPDANPRSRMDGLVRYQANPEPNWGPGTRATARFGEEKLAKSIKNQNKNSKKPNKDDGNTSKRQRSPSIENSCKKANVTVE